MLRKLIFESLNIRDYIFNNSELDLIFGLYVATRIFSYSGVEKSFVTKESYPTLISNKMIEKKRKNIDPTNKLDFILDNDKTIKTIYKYLKNIPKNNLPYNGFFTNKLFRDEYEDFLNGNND